jgi:uncharacterized protein YukE
VGGGGDNGGFFFTNLGDLDKIIKQLMSLRERARRRNSDLNSAMHAVVAPAADTASRDYAKAVRGSLARAMTHNSKLKDALDTYVEKLNQAKTRMARTEQGNAGMLAPADGG